MTKQEFINELKKLHTSLRKNNKLEFEKFTNFNGVWIYTTRNGYAFSFKYKGVEFDYYESRNELETKFEDYSDYLTFDSQTWLNDVESKITS